MITLDFIKPIAGMNTSEYTIISQANGTTVTWAMYGPSPFVPKVMQVFVSMDKLIGGDFESGLATMMTVAEKA